MNSPYGLPGECLSCQMRSGDSFCALSQESLKALNQIKHPAVFPEDAVIFVEGQSPRGIFVLCEGQAKLSTTSSSGRTFIVRIAKPGEVLGLHAIITGKPYEMTVETMQPSRLAFVGRQEFLRFLAAHSDASLRAAQQIGRDCQDAYGVIRSIGLSHSASGKVAKFLLAWAAGGVVTKGVVRAKLALTHEDIAQLVGTSRETITRILSEFRRKEIVELKGSNLTIHDKPALERMVAA
jgi:CRP/FNR family transcriptional regulator, cyclic AMP receptor protein